LVVEKEVKICDECKEKKSKEKCCLCDKDLCADCLRGLDIDFTTRDYDEDADSRLIFTFKERVCKACYAYLRKKASWAIQAELIKEKLIPELKKERLADSL
jgi:hypothetical protein